jgi:hypothetical protein
MVVPEKVLSLSGQREFEHELRMEIGKKSLKNVGKNFPKKKSALEILPSGLTVRTPISREEIVSWGTMQNHCLAGYAANHLKSVLIFGVFEGDKLVYNALVSSNKEGKPFCDYGHFQGVNNTSVPNDVKEEVLEGIACMTLFQEFFKQDKEVVPEVVNPNGGWEVDPFGDWD